MSLIGFEPWALALLLAGFAAFVWLCVDLHRGTRRLEQKSVASDETRMNTDSFAHVCKPARIAEGQMLAWKCEEGGKPPSKIGTKASGDFAKCYQHIAASGQRILSVSQERWS